MSPKMISDSIGFDGTHFFCRRCGKAGYNKLAQVKGHLAMCPGTAIRKGAVPASSQLVATVQGAGLQGAESQPVAASYSPVAAAFSGVSPGFPSYQQEQQQLAARVAKLENEAHHMLMSRNEPVGDWLGRNKNLLIFGLVAAAVMYMLMQQSKCVCDGSGRSSGGSNGAKLGKFGEKAFSKLTDRVISKSVDSIFR